MKLNKLLVTVKALCATGQAPTLLPHYSTRFRPEGCETRQISLMGWLRHKTRIS
ncbi:hypothetical protein [Kalamiella sp. sgz302252]|uniref:hypothetical protein n=1 Tax=Pantoea sp. sgz302252 TaxID=3341827 RepID=UPI0036D24A27